MHRQEFQCFVNHKKITSTTVSISGVMYNNIWGIAGVLGPHASVRRTFVLPQIQHGLFKKSTAAFLSSVRYKGGEFIIQKIN